LAEGIAPEWLIEDGIGETRALLIKGGQVLAAKLRWPGELIAGDLHPAKLIAKPAGARRGVATIASGEEVLVDHLPRSLTEGQSFTLRIVRAAIAERGRLKRAQGRHVAPDEATAAPAPESPFATGERVRRFPAGSWEEVWLAASSGEMAFSGGAILCSVTPAMTVIDVDCGWPQEAYFNAVPMISTALRWFDIGGNIGIDFPTILDKSDRKACDNRLAEYLADWPHECTAMNGFGFVQLVARLEGPSLLHRFATARLGAAARMALRRGELAAETGTAGRTLLLTVHPALKAKLKPEWLAELVRRTGRAVRIETDPGLAIEAAHAQLVSA